MRTKKQALEELTFNIYYLCKCEHCGEEIIVEKDEFDNFYGVPEHKDDERTWKCCNCGHVNTEKSMDLWSKHCNEYGKNNITFELDDVETERARAFIEKHDHSEEIKARGKGDISAVGEQFSYIMTPSGLGDRIAIRCNYCGETEDITNVDNW